MLCSIPFYGQDNDSILINREVLKDILLSEAEYKNSWNLLAHDTTNLRLIINSKDVVIEDQKKIIVNNEEVNEGLQSTLESVKAAYEDAVKKNRWENFLKVLVSVLIGFGAGFLSGAL